MFQQQPVDKDVAAADLAQEDAVVAVVEETGVIMVTLAQPYEFLADD